MKISVSSTLFLFSLSCIQGCFDEKANSCMEVLSSKGVEDGEQACRQLEDITNCVKAAAEECEDEVNDDVEENLSWLAKILKPNCEGGKSDDGKSKLSKCLEKNEEYLFGCMYEAEARTLEIALRRENVDENFIKCSLYHGIADCFEHRAGEKCGMEAELLMEECFNYVPEDIQGNCKAAGLIRAHHPMPRIPHDFSLEI